MRLGFGQLGLAVALGLLAGCSGKATDLSVKLGCGEIDGLGVLTSEKAPAFILVGEVIETNELPPAFAELACQLAARQPKDKPLWVGLSDYVGGSTDAERAMRKRLEDLIARGAPMVLGSASEGHTTGVSRREEAERLWAEDIKARMKSANASRALLLMPRFDGVAVRVTGIEGRFSDYTPMALFLPEGQVMNLEIGQATNIGSPTIRIYTTMRQGYMGQIALGKVTLAEKTEPVRPPN